MSHSRSRDAMTHGSSGAALQREREREKKRREREQMRQQEHRVDEPVFSQPRKVTTSRQDSLTRNINSILGDSKHVGNILFQEPNIWLGTSRSSQGPPTPAPAPPQDEGGIYTSANTQKPSPSQKNSSQRRAGSYSANSYIQSSKSGPPPISSSSSQPHRSSAPASTHGFSKSRDDSSGRSHSSSSNTKAPHDSYSRNRHAQSHSSSQYSGSKSDHDKTVPTSTFNSSHLPIVQKGPTLPLDGHDKSEGGLKVELPSRISERDRVSSIDSDMLSGVENILKEMVDLPCPPLTEIKTPSVGDGKFNFPKRKLGGPESSIESSNTEAGDVGVSESESSDNESSDEEPEDFSSSKVTNNNNWNLSAWTAPKESPVDSKPIKADGFQSAPRSGDYQSPRVSNNNVSATRGRKSDKKQSSSKNSSRTRSSSSSSQRSASPGHRSASSGRRSAHGQSRTSTPNFNQIDHPKQQNWSKNSKNDTQGQIHPGVSISPSGASRPSPRAGSSVREHPPQVSKNNPQSSPSRHRNSPNVREPQQSRVSKQTVSRTAQNTKARHKVGHKVPSYTMPKTGYSSSSHSNPIKQSSQTAISNCSSSSESEMSDAEGDATIKNPIQSSPIPPVVDHPMPSDSNSDTSSSDTDSSDASDSESEGETPSANFDGTHFKTPDSPPSQVSWKLVDLRMGGNVNVVQGKSPKHAQRKEAQGGAAKDPSRNSPFHPNSQTSRSPKFDQNNSFSTSQHANEKSKEQQRSQSNKSRKESRKSAPSAMTPAAQNSWDNRTPKRSPREGSEKVSPKSQNTCWNNVWSNDRNTTVKQRTQNRSFAKNGRASSVNSETEVLPRESSYHDRKSGYDTANTVNAVPRSPSKKHSSVVVPSRDEFKNSFPSLWVSIKALLLQRGPNTPSHKPPHNVPNTRPAATPNRSSPHAKSPKVQNYAQQRCSTTVSTGSETEQPIRRADNVQVAVADGSTDWAGHGSMSASKRKLNSSDAHYDEPHNLQTHSNSTKRRKRDTPSRQPSPASSPWLPERKKTPPNEHWREPPVTGRPSDQTSNNHPSVRHPNHPANDGYHNRTPNHPPSLESYHHNRASMTRTNFPSRRESPTSNNPTSQPVLPDSSVPEQERIQTSDYYMREGKRMKHEGDGLTSTRNGRTRPGEALSRALAYFEASLFFIMSGYVMEAENNAERAETGSNSGSSSTSHSPTNMYQQTVQLLDFVLKMRPHIEQDDKVFKRIVISCVRCQAVLYFRIFKLKKDVAAKYSELLNDQFKNMSKTNRTPSPWDHNANAAPHVLSPMSPAVPSPFGHPGPSPVSSNGEQVTSSTQAGKMTPPSHNNMAFPQKTYDMYRQHHTIMRNLLLAHEKWDLGENLIESHADFFRNIDTLCSRTLNFHTSLRDVFLYHKVVLHQLRALPTNSPHE